MDYQEIESMVDHLEEMRLIIVNQRPAPSEEQLLNAVYDGIAKAQSNLRGLLAQQIAISAG